MDSVLLRPRNGARGGAGFDVACVQNGYAFPKEDSENGLVQPGVIADSLDIPVSEVYGVATFYSQFSLRPKGENVVSVCTGTACYVKGAQAVLEEVENVLGIKAGETTKDGKFTIQDTRCLGCCGLAPVMVINEDVYGRLTPADIKGIFEKY